MPAQHVAVRSGDLRSPVWTFASDETTKPNVFVSREGTKQFVHLSLHGDAEWHLAIEGHGYQQLPIPAPNSQGIVCAVRIAVVRSAVRHEAPTPYGDVAWVEQPIDETLCIQLVLLLMAPGSTLIVKNFASDNCWDSLLPNGWRCILFAQAGRLASGSLTVPAAEPRGDSALVWGVAEDGSIVLIDGPLLQAP